MPSSTTRRSASSCAAARAASARPPSRPPWRCGRPSAGGTSWCSPSTRPAGWLSRWASPSWTTRRVRWRGSARQGGAGGSLDAMMLDMKRTFDEVVESQASPEKARQILDNTFYQALSSSFAGTQEYMAMEKLGQIHRDAQRRGQLRPDRRRHPALAVGAGLPRRARAALELPRRPLHPPAAHPRAGTGAVDDGRVQHLHQRPDQGARRPVPPRRADVRHGARHAVRRVPHRAQNRPSACCRPTGRRSSSSPRPSPTRCARRRTSSNGSARTACRSPAWWSTGPPRLRPMG